MRKLFAYAPHYLREIYASDHQSGIFWSAATFTKLCTTKVAAQDSESAKVVKQQFVYGLPLSKFPNKKD